MCARAVLIAHTVVVVVDCAVCVCAQTNKQTNTFDTHSYSAERYLAAVVVVVVFTQC